jgi:RNA polymerase sigma-70 factor (ECF subfamily)
MMKGADSNTNPEPILPRIAAGEPGAVEVCLDRYKGLVWWLARQMAGSEAEDAVQEIFIQLWQNADRYDPSMSSEPAFVSMIARRRLIDRHRRVERRPSTESLDGKPWEMEGSDGRAAEHMAEVALAARAIRQLRPEEQRVVQLSIVEGMTHSEIAEHTEMPLGTVKTYIRRGLIRVRELLSERRGPGVGTAEGVPA